MDATERSRRNISSTWYFGTTRAAVSNCHGTDFSFKNCQQPCTNASGFLKPQLGQLGDNGETYSRWQRRMLSHHRSNYAGDGNARSSSSSQRRRHTSRRNYNTNNRRTDSRHTNVGKSQHDNQHCNAGRYPPLQLGQHDAQSGGPATNCN